MVDAPVNIRGIKKYIMSTVAADTVETPAPLPATGKRVAVVGAGPSGLTCAYFLGLMGHAVTVFERRSRLGGMMRYGIPAYRLPRERLDEDIRAVLGAGDIEVRTGCDVQTDEMRTLVDEFDAVYVAVGAQGGKTLSIEGADAAGVMSAVDVLEAIGDEQYPDFTGKNVVVIGGGAGWYFKIYRSKKQRAAESEADYGGEYDGAEDYDETDPEDDGPPWDEDGEE